MASLLLRSLRAPPMHPYSAVQAANGCLLSASPSSLHLSLVRCFRRDQGRIEVILNEDIRNLGYKDDIVQVRRGYARNILVPRNRAIYATNDNRRARNLPPLQLQRPPAALHDSTTATAATTPAASAATNHSRRYLKRADSPSRPPATAVLSTVAHGYGRVPGSADRYAGSVSTAHHTAQGLLPPLRRPHTARTHHSTRQPRTGGASEGRRGGRDGRARGGGTAGRAGAAWQ